MLKSKQLQSVAERYEINTLYLFGSYVDGSYHEDSDIDLAFLSTGYENKFDYGRLYFDLQEEVNREIDLIDLRKAPLTFAYSIIKDGRVIYDLYEDIRTDFEDDTIRKYLDFLYFHRLIQAELDSKFQLRDNMIRLSLVYDRVAVIDKSLNRLEQFRENTMEEFILNSDNYAIAEHHLRISLEAVFDLGRHLLVKTGLGKPNDYRDILILLGRNNIIPYDFLERIKGMAGYRNRLVHMYNEIGPEELYNIITTRLGDIRELTAFLLKYVRLNGEKA